ncbi:SgcJ/EcaC family oxidoreductase [Pseudomonas sp. HR96]|uniref:SgcJ/EcaC family oxidoreductase n=1 Tax=Pseudomonas sp. HR96 TaxID=1027966 RepID=UPI002A75D196|nr:SgcJ/EcaC family oxidoreductase [Pseudomonas sp. HR96]WPO97985.1 SgcJ/EcaC family oxidoreductase [Pseudomonas sp. HR96]
MKLHLPLATLFLSIGCATAQAADVAPTAQCQTASEADIQALFVRWNDSLKTGDPQKVVANYAPVSVLLPTVSNKVRLSAEEKADYFTAFLANQPQGRIDSRSILLGCNSAVDAGLYTFTYGTSGKTVQARYSYSYGWDGAQWLITSHHSSAMPEG